MLVVYRPLDGTFAWTELCSLWINMAINRSLIHISLEWLWWSERSSLEGLLFNNSANPLNPASSVEPPCRKIDGEQICMTQTKSDTAVFCLRDLQKRPIVELRSLSKRFPTRDESQQQMQQHKQTRRQPNIECVSCSLPFGHCLWKSAYMHQRICVWRLMTINIWYLSQFQLINDRILISTV